MLSCYNKELLLVSLLAFSKVSNVLSHLDYVSGSSTSGSKKGGRGKNMEGILCPGQEPDDYCDCGYDCYEVPRRCECEAAQECCKGISGRGGWSTGSSLSYDYGDHHNHNCETKFADVVIIGAGYAGIRAAVAIKEKASDLSVVVLEASNHIGGRAKSGSIGNYTVPLGPKRLFRYDLFHEHRHEAHKSDPTLDLFNEYNLSYVDDDPKNMTVFTFSDACTEETNTGRKLSNSRKLKKAYALLDHVKNDRFIDSNTKEKTVVFLETAIERRLNQNSCVVNQVSQEKVKDYQNRFQKNITKCVMEKADKAWENDDLSYDNEPGLLYDYLNCGYNDTDSMEFMMKWFWYDFELAHASGSIYGFYDPWEKDSVTYYTPDGGYSTAIQKYAEDNDIKPLFHHRVERIQYNIRKGNVRAEVRVKTSENKCLIYESQRVISTVSTGVYNTNLIEFEPKLRYNEIKFNPMRMNRYLNIWYQFPTKFWEENAGQAHYIYTLCDENHDGVSLNWQNLDREGLLPGSKILLLTLTEEGFVKVFGENYREKEIVPMKLRELLEPLKVVFGNNYTEPTEMIYNQFHGDENFGFGSYSEWDAGYSPYDYFKFWGAYDFNDYIAPCQHNGCNGSPKKNDTEWILYLSGTASCLELWEWVEGAWYAGEMAAYLMMESLGIDLHDWKTNYTCYPWI